MPEVGIQNTAAKRIQRLKHRSNREKKKIGEENTTRASKAAPHLRQDRSLLVLAVFAQPPVTDSVVTPSTPYECMYGMNAFADSAGLTEYGVNECCVCWSSCGSGVGKASNSAHLRAH